MTYTIAVTIPVAVIFFQFLVLTTCFVPPIPIHGFTSLLHRLLYANIVGASRQKCGEADLLLHQGDIESDCLSLTLLAQRGGTSRVQAKLPVL